MLRYYFLCFFFSSRRRHTRCALVTWSSDVCSSDLYEAISDDPALFSSDERAILKLGLGRNMVKSIRFWGDAFGLTRQAGGETRATEFADRLLDPEAGLDRYLERSEEHTSELQSLMRISYAVFCLKKKKRKMTGIY